MLSVTAYLKKETEIHNTNLYEFQDLTPGKFIIHKIVEQPGWFILLVSLVWLLGILDLFFMKSTENDLSYQLKSSSSSDMTNIQKDKSLISTIKNISLLQPIYDLRDYIDKNIESVLVFLKSNLSNNGKEIFKILVHFVLLRIISSIAKSVTVYLSFKLAAQWIAQIKDAIFQKIQNLSPHYFEEKDSIGILSKSFENSISALGAVIARGSKVSKNLIEVLITFAGFCTHSKLLGLITSLWITIHIAMCWTYLRPARDAHSRLSYLDGRQSSFLSERLRNKHIETFLNLKSHNMRSFQGITHSMQDMIEDLAKPSALLLMSIFILTTILQIGWFTYTLIKFDSIKGKEKAIIFVSNLLLIEAIYEMSQDIPKIIENSVQIPQIFNIINDPKNQERHRKNLSITEECPDIEIHNLSLSIGDRTVFENLSFTIPHGSKVAIVGASGSGKTTFVNMIAGLNEKYSGLITIGGKDIREVSRRSIENKIGYIFSTQTLLSGSLRENIAMGKILSDQQIKEILRKCQLEYLLNKMNIDTPLGEGEGILSSGEKKRVMIARSLSSLKEKDIVIFDETLSNLDATTAAEIYEMLQPYMENKTIFFIDHSGLLPKDIVFFFPRNRKAIISRHDLLMNDDEEYRTMMESSPFTNKK
jgi:ABC-type multidrug transport system fused ATPase/permease subunit